MIYNLDKINEMAGDDDAFVGLVISAFLEEVPEDLGELEAAIAELDHKKVYKLAHKIKPNVDILGMDRSRAWALEIETLGKSSANMEEIKEKFPMLKQEVLQVVEQLKKDFDL